MKLIFKGIYKTKDQLPKGVLPDNAVKFREPDTVSGACLVSMLFIFPAALFIILCIFASYILHGELNISVSRVGIYASFLTVLPHELLHVIAFGKGTEAELYISPKHFSAFVTSTKPITKGRFIIMSLLPNITFGLIPMLAWVVLPNSEMYSPFLFGFSLISILFGLGDYLNVFNAIRQMPKGSMHQLSGINSYWFMPQDTIMPKD